LSFAQPLLCFPANQSPFSLNALSLLTPLSKNMREDPLRDVFCIFPGWMVGPCVSSSLPSASVFHFLSIHTQLGPPAYVLRESSRTRSKIRPCRQEKRFLFSPSFLVPSSPTSLRNLVFLLSCVYRATTVAQKSRVSGPFLRWTSPPSELLNRKVKVQVGFCMFRIPFGSCSWLELPLSRDEMH